MALSDLNVAFLQANQVWAFHLLHVGVAARGELGGLSDHLEARDSADAVASERVAARLGIRLR